jgi:EpsI family protein
MDRTKTGTYVAVIVFLGALVAYTHELRFRSDGKAETPSYDLISREAAGFTSTEEERDTAPLKLLGADATVYRTYRNAAGRTAWLFLGYFGAPHENSQIHSPKHCYPGAGWNILEEGSAPLRFGARTMPVKHLVIFNGVERHYVLYWFTSCNGILTNEFALKWDQMKNSLLRRSQASAFVRFSMPVNPGEDDASVGRELARFAESLAPNVEDVMSRAGAAPRIDAPAGTGSSERGNRE